MKRILSAAFVFLFSFSNTYSQTIDSTIEKYGNDFGQERTYLHYDKSTYAAGETVWYKAYIMNGIFAADESKTFYVDWTDDKGKLLLHSLVPVVYATAAGQFDIPAEYTGRYIHVKAYTKWMLNFDSSFLYNKDIRVLSKTSSGASKNSSLTSLQFFPEGGDIITGINNKIAFKATDQFGRPGKIKGSILNEKGIKIDSLHVIHDGMGYFFLSPKEGETFKAKWKDEKGMEHSSALPEAKKSGVALQVTISGNKRNFKVTASNPNTLSIVHLIGTMYQHEVFSFSKDISSGNIQGSIPGADLPSGILTVTVFDDHWKPLAERITYINNHEYLFNAEMSVEHWGLNKRAKNEIRITVTDSLPANFSVAVTDMDIDADSSDNIISHLMLTGDLKGQVYNPSYYFSNASDSLIQNLDLVMLTHGWRRFKWDDVIVAKFPKIIYPRDTSYLTLTGKIYGGSSVQFRNAGNIVLIMNQNKQNKMLVVPIQSNGSFSDPSVVLFDSTHFFYKLSQASGLEDASVKFMENRLPPVSNSATASPVFSTLIFDTSGYARHYSLADELAQLASFNKAKVLETVTIKARVKSPVQLLDEKYASGLFSGGDGYQFDLINDTKALSSLNIFTYLQGQVAGLQINTSSTPPSLSWRGGSPALFLDEAPADADLIAGIPVTDVAYIKVLRPPFMGSSGGANGAIAIYTRRGDDRKPAPGKGLNNNLVSGYNSMREFYSPNYNSFTTDNDKRDLRTTLYWNPQVTTTHLNNQALLTFYNNDVSGAFRVIIEGMSSDGHLVHIENIMQ